MKDLEIKKRRKKLNLTQEQLAKLLGVSVRTVLNYEKGEVIPDSKQELLRKILTGNNAQTIPDKDIKKVIEIITLNENQLMKNKQFANWVEMIQGRAIIDYLETVKEKIKNQTTLL